MTNHWRDIKNADVILINGANPAEAHPVGFQWFVKAKLDPTKGPGAGGGAKIVHADPRFTRTSALADTYLRIRTGTDVAYFGGLINYVLQNDLYHADYVKNYTNASFIVREGYDFKDGLFSGYNQSTRSYDISSWAYETEGTPLDGPAGTTQARAKRDMTLQHPRSVFQLLKKHYSRYTADMVSSITGIPILDFVSVAKLVGEMGKPDKVMTIVYAVGLTHHTTGGQLIRSGALLQLLLGNMGRPGGGMKPAANSSWMSIFDQALKGKMEGVILSGMTATSIGPDSNQVLQGLANLKWLVVMDPLPTTSSEFWRAPGMDAAKIQTEVFMLPTTHWIEKDGSFVNSGRWSQWKEAVLPPEGDARHDHWIMAELFDRLKQLYRQQGGKFPDPIMAMTLGYKDPKKPELDEIAKEINGKDLATGSQMTSFANLKADGTTTSGDWIYVGSYPDAGTLAKRRNGVQDVKANDPTGMGFFLNWAWSWPLNRRVLYNRASADADGKPWDPKRPGIQWNGTAWTGDVPDYPATMNPKDPAAWLPFIMNGEGVGRLFSSSMLDGPIPEHYEPYEAPIPNPLHPGVSEDPVAFLYDQAAGRPSRFGKVDKYPYVATSYRLTEHEHYVTQHVPLLVGLQPQAFVEIPEELASEKGIKNGDRVRVSSARGKLEVSALVTKRLGPITLAGNKKVYQIGIPIHWGFVGVSAEQNPEKSKYWLADRPS